ncbi:MULTISPECIES: hypothetical protein [Acinetobacter calcoaceticus/baumannii complex]|uniref:Uncharacterized protein n=1 Tax=Acinetobacter baumannii (strain AB0057) TaxID=480119 RepID=A0A7U3Y5A9_ACIB5|nr:MULTISPECIES: hypothetical protein [Acinetobacter calcoaceticus/baumannii complex]PXA49632.1 hypothetical protein DMB35_19510 [Acinetobacter baumannii A424]ACJ40325.1 hypothetical protein AB57_1302 [Acinetobacter baumannii AB0057]ASF76652.1 hypothetical protein CBI29_01271 [Acinetobacter baumannii]ATD21617.1 hypothetical protein BS098_17625 [Acinetobacter baumannii]ATP87860.1 hypothetical protein A388_02652 [Acinetobacter baumannii]
MSDKNLRDPYNRHLADSSPAWDAYPHEEKVCVITEPLCNDHIKIRNYYMARPYNFMMRVNQWAEVANTIELLMAVRFGMEWDMNKFDDRLLADPGFHTQMYIRFHNYVLKHAMKEGARIVGEFQQTAFKVRFLSAFAVDELLELRNLSKFDQGKEIYGKIQDLKDTFAKLNAARATTDLAQLRMNDGPLFINREMFKKVFNQDFNPKMIQIMKQTREYPGDPINVREKGLY